jgi:hypothetical protein
MIERRNLSVKSRHQWFSFGMAAALADKQLANVPLVFHQAKGSPSTQASQARKLCSSRLATEPLGGVPVLLISPSTETNRVRASPLRCENSDVRA